jgi:copper ion binding protein
VTAQTWTVSGMTCEHCVASVTEEVTALPGVRRVHVDLASGRLAVDADEPLGDADVRAAVEDAGYELV